LAKGAFLPTWQGAASALLLLPCKTQGPNRPMATGAIIVEPHDWKDPSS